MIITVEKDGLCHALRSLPNNAHFRQGCFPSLSIINKEMSWTDGWIDEELKETPEGSEYALQKTFNFLKALS
jgi:hypothetical protein